MAPFVEHVDEEAIEFDFGLGSVIFENDEVSLEPNAAPFSLVAVVERTDPKSVSLF